MKKDANKGMDRKSIATNVSRKLWAQCGGYCQNPDCNRYLFADIGDDSVSLANIAHIIGAGENGPRSEDELADFIDKNGFTNLIMLCLECHKIVDELERRFPTDVMRAWKSEHHKRIETNFVIPAIHDERELLVEISQLLDNNRTIFEECGPFSRKATDGDAGDSQKIWKRRCLDTILPNNKRIIDLIEKNKRNFGYPWELYRKMQEYKIHADSFRENCLFDERINDYKLFPRDFDDFVKTSLGICIEDRKKREQEELEYRQNTISSYINQYLLTHKHIVAMEKWNQAIFLVVLCDGRTLRVFVTNTYHFTEYTLEKVLAVDPSVDAIICSNPYSTYSESAKRQCIQESIGLFMLKEFMGAIRMDGDKFLNYLVNSERDERIQDFSSRLHKNPMLVGICKIYLFGSFLRQKVYDDIDVIVVPKQHYSADTVDNVIRKIIDCLGDYPSKLDFTVCSEEEFSKLGLTHDNRVRVL